MNRKSQTLMVSLWILVILTILAVSVGHRVSMALRLSRYQKDKLKASCLAKAGINRAIVELEKDSNDYDALMETWANNENVFKKIMLTDDQNEFATVSYDTIDENNNPKVIYGTMDEERKININTASKELLLSLLEECQISPSQDIVNYILIWRGVIADDQKIYYEELGYSCKADKFTNIQELKLVKDIDDEEYQKLKGLVTVYGDSDKCNANTASKEVLTILANSLAVTDEEKSYVTFVVDDIITQINEKGYFKTLNDIEVRDVVSGSSADENLYNKLKDKLTVKSDNFLIEVTGFVSKIRSKILVVYNRKNKKVLKKVLCWHES